MKYYLIQDNNIIKSISNKPIEVYTNIVEVPIKFKSKGICKNNWEDILNWITDNTEIKRKNRQI